MDDWTVRGKTVFITGAARGSAPRRRAESRRAGQTWRWWASSPGARARGRTVRHERCLVRMRRHGPRGARRRGRRGGRALRRHRRLHGERGHRPDGDCALHGSRRVRADDRDQPARRVAHGPRLPPARDRAPGLRARIASLAAAMHAPGMAAYAASKAGAEAFGDSLRQEVKHLGVDVGVGYFSFIDTDMVRGADSHLLSATCDTRCHAARSAKTYPLSDAGQAIADGIEKRRRWIVVPPWARALLVLRTALAPLAERGQRRLRRRGRPPLRGGRGGPRRRGGLEAGGPGRAGGGSGGDSGGLIPPQARLNVARRHQVGSVPRISSGRSSASMRRKRTKTSSWV